MRRNKGYIGQAWLVLALATSFGGVLATVHVFWQPKIDANKRNEVYSQIPVLVGGADQEAIKELEIAGLKVYQAFNAAGECVGYVVRAKGQGFADQIELLVGLDAAAETITGLYVLDQKETPGLGNKIAPKYPWDDQFNGKKAGQALSAVKAAPAGDANEVQAVTGATVSSIAVCDIINKALAKVRPELKKLIGEMKE